MNVPISITFGTPARYVGYKNLHRTEGGFPSPQSMPNVRRAINAPPVPFTPELQERAFELMVAKNPLITWDKFRGVFSGSTAFTNNHGVESDDPKLMDGIICAGMFLRGVPGYSLMVGIRNTFRSIRQAVKTRSFTGLRKSVVSTLVSNLVSNNVLVCTPGIHAIDATRPLPGVAEILEHNWYFVANTGQGPSGAYHFPQGSQGPVYVIYALVEPVRYEMSGVEENIAYTNFMQWDSDVLPDPLAYYL